MNFDNGGLPDGLTPERLIGLYDKWHSPGLLYNVGRTAVWLDIINTHRATNAVSYGKTEYEGLFLPHWNGSIELEDGYDRSWSQVELRIHAMPSAEGIETIARDAELTPGKDTFQFQDCPETDEDGKIPMRSFVEHFARGVVPLSVGYKWSLHDRREGDHVFGYLSTPSEMKDLIETAAQNALATSEKATKAVGIAIDEYSEFLAQHCLPIWEEGRPQEDINNTTDLHNAIRVIYEHATEEEMEAYEEMRQLGNGPLSVEQIIHVYTEAMRELIAKKPHLAPLARQVENDD